MRCRGRLDARRDDRYTALLEVGRQRAYSPACRHDAAVALEERHLDAFAVELWKTRGHVGGSEHLRRHAEPRQSVACVTRVLIASRRHPQNTGSMPERSEEHTSELQSQSNLVCRLLLEKKKKKQRIR